VRHFKTGGNLHPGPWESHASRKGKGGERKDFVFRKEYERGLSVGGRPSEKGTFRDQPKKGGFINVKQEIRKVLIQGLFPRP